MEWALVRGTFDSGVLNEKGITQIQTPNGQNVISVLQVSFKSPKSPNHPNTDTEWPKRYFGPTSVIKCHNIFGPWVI
jgi:hypothetical protein